MSRNVMKKIRSCFSALIVGFCLTSFVACVRQLAVEAIPSMQPINSALPAKQQEIEIDFSLPSEAPINTQEAIPSPSPIEASLEPTSVPTADPTEEPSPDPTPEGLLGGRFSGFSTQDGFQKTETSYTSKNVSIVVTRYDSSPLTRRLVYFVTDVHLQDLSSLRTESWDQNFGTRGEKLWMSFLKMSRRVNALVAINGDYYTYNIHTGLVIRNGVRYAPDPWKPWKGHDILLLYRDGTMETFHSDTFQPEAIDQENVWQAWEFGPSLLDENGNALSSFDRSYSDINRANPRTILGYYEPGHYCFVTVDGRKSGYSNGLTLPETAQLMESLGCKIAFNLDGGQTTQLYWNDQMYNVPYEGGRFTSDIIYIVDVDENSQRSE